MMFTKMDKRLKYGLVLGVILALIVATVALADNVQNNVVVGGNDTFTLGGSTVVNYRISQTGQGNDGQNGCNAADGSPAILTINTPSGVTATPDTLEFNDCGVANAESTTFTATTAGDYQITVSVADNGDGTYDTSQATFTLHVLAGKVTPTITWNNPADITYGTELDGIQLNATAWYGGDPVDGSFDYTPAAGTVLGAGTHSLSVEFTPDDTSTYNTASAMVSINVLKVATTTTVSCPESVTYNGSEHTPCSASVTGPVGLNQVLTVSYTNNVNAGTATASASYTESANYLGSSDSETFTIDKAATISLVTCDPGPFTYNGAAHEPCSATVTGPAGLNETLVVSYENNVNAGTATANASYAESENYLGSSDSENFTIGQKAASVIAVNKSKTYGDDNPTLTATVVGEVAGGDSINYSLSTTAEKFSNVGDYPIVVALGSNPNYDVAATDGTLTIDPKAASVTAVNKSKTYGDDNPTLTATVVGEVAGGDVIDYSLSTTAGQFSDVGDYPIVVALGSNPNYDVTATVGTLTITTRPITVTANPGQSKVLGAPDPVFTYSITSGDLVDDDSFSGELSREPGETVGEYDILVGTLTAGSNYNLTFVSAKFKILYASLGLCYGAPGHTILQPINVDGNSVFKKNSTVPAKFRVCDAFGNSIGTAGVVASFKVISIGGAPTSGVNETVISTTPDTAFRWDPAEKQWIFNINTKSLSIAKYTYRIELNDGSEIIFSFGLK